MPEPSTGTLFLVATPIGNLEDMTLRGLRILREAALVAAEDTRHTAKLLNHYDIRTPSTSLHEHNEERKIATLVARLLSGERIALVSDAGTPAVSDPGFRLVRAAIAAGIRVEPVPGPSAVLAALTASGLPTDSFVFLGFPPGRAGERRRWFLDFKDERRTLILFEAPHRIRKTLLSALDSLGDRQAAVARELTKVHEDLVRGPISSILESDFPERGEFTVVLAGASRETRSLEVPGLIPGDSFLYQEFCSLTESGLARRAIISTLARKYRLPARRVYQAVELGRQS